MRQEMTGSWKAVASAGYTNTTSLNFYRPDALPDAQPTVKALKAQNAVNVHKIIKLESSSQ